MIVAQEQLLRANSSTGESQHHSTYMTALIGF